LGVGFAAKALEVDALAAGEDVPIDVAEIVALGVLAVFGEFLAKAEGGERCRPATKPSTTVFATRSSEEMDARTAGSRKRWSMD